MQATGVSGSALTAATASMSSLKCQDVPKPKPRCAKPEHCGQLALCGSDCFPVLLAVSWPVATTLPVPPRCPSACIIAICCANSRTSDNRITRNERRCMCKSVGKGYLQQGEPEAPERQREQAEHATVRSVHDAIAYQNPTFRSQDCEAGDSARRLLIQSTKIVVKRLELVSNCDHSAGD